MLDPKVLLIKHRVNRLAKKLADRNAYVPEEFNEKLKIIWALEAEFSVVLTESQISCALLMYHGCFAQLATGEGKTFSIALTAAWLAKEGRCVHIVTPNEYLSKRDSLQLKPFFKSLDLDSCWIGSTIPENERFELYKSNIVYATPSIIAFDQMRERSKIDQSINYQYISEQTTLIIDEADAILIENGSIPFIFAKNTESDSDFWKKSVSYIMSLGDSNFEYDIQTESSYLSDCGFDSVENFLIKEGYIFRNYDLYSSKNSGFFHKIFMAVRAVKDFHENIDYLVNDGQIAVLNQSTGRVEKDRQWGQGLHQAIEAKHGLTISDESDICSKITVPEILELYSDFSGTSATILHAQEEILSRYGRLTIEVKRSHKDLRIFHKDQCYDSLRLKQDVIVEDIASRHSCGQPVLIGTESISEALDIHEKLNLKGIKHSLLTARHEDKEASIIAEAGSFGAVTIATNMAGRGTDIRLGGSSEKERDRVIKSGGLYVIGSSRQSERRLDDQLAGRCGRQGDPGAVRFYLSLGDKLFKDQDKIATTRSVTKKSLMSLQKSKANKISVSRDEIDAFNDVFIIHREIFFSLRKFWESQNHKDAINELLNIFIVNIRLILLDYGINKKGAYKDIYGFISEITKKVEGIDRIENKIHDLNSQFSGAELCSEIEKLLVSELINRRPDKKLLSLRSEVLASLDELWGNHQLLLEQIYDHSKWQALIQKNEKVQFSIFGFDAMSEFIENIEYRLVDIIIKGE